MVWLWKNCYNEEKISIDLIVIKNFQKGIQSNKRYFSLWEHINFEWRSIFNT